MSCHSSNDAHFTAHCADLDCVQQRPTDHFLNSVQHIEDKSIKETQQNRPQKKAQPHTDPC